ncbi:element excision factor XisH family protein [Aliterella atlantica]|uniref:Fatty-acid oxidation protein subunit alpha n=1 Tax=Aliterella atlantica CENA595 TaxID=1618023 RepID=A0A0D8ZXX4_9CYAN|nr:element excision factor XisH family protein [Aliterella atlantica]KJH73284.1 fatty-acid oxidation protein subunit alpha [Aliterella atlantica CENA595]
MARDLFHNIVRTALEKDGWTITDDPLSIRCGGVDIQIDLGLEKLLAAEKGTNKIAVEIKNFVSASKISEFHTALGQFINYRTALRIEEPTRVLYLAVPSAIYSDFFSLPFTQTVVDENCLKIIVYDLDKEEIVEWIN